MELTDTELKIANGVTRRIQRVQRHLIEFDDIRSEIYLWMVQHNDKVVLSAQWGPSVAKNPFLQFTINSARTGDKVAITWVDNRGDTRTDEATVS